MTLPKVKTAHEVLYCPEEEDWEKYVKYHDVNYDWGDILAVRRARKKAGLCNACAKKATPIYNHQFAKVSNLNPSLFTNNYSFPNTITNPKKLLNKVEESYWSNWKPKKVKSPRPSARRRTRPQKEDREFHSDEDAGQQLIDYFSKKNYSSSSASVDERCFFKPRKDKKDKKTDSSPFPLILEEKRGAASDISVIHSFEGNRTYSVSPSENDGTPSRQASHITIPADDEGGSTTKIKNLKHTDSFIIIKKKQEQNADKIRFRQPKCIKLFRKKPPQIKGGSYPLNSPSTTKQSGKKGIFRLGAPGSPILVAAGGAGNGRGGRV